MKKILILLVLLAGLSSVSPVMAQLARHQDHPVKKYDRGQEERTASAHGQHGGRFKNSEANRGAAHRRDSRGIGHRRGFHGKRHGHHRKGAHPRGQRRGGRR